MSRILYAVAIVVIIIVTIVSIVPFYLFASIPVKSPLRFKISTPKIARCTLSFVETIPRWMALASSHQTTEESWLQLLNSSSRPSVDLATFYWTMLAADVKVNASGTDTSSEAGQRVFARLKQLAPALRIVQNQGYFRDTHQLATHGAQVRNLSMPRFTPDHAGILHTKMWLVGGTHAYLGSANMDFRALSHVKELGLHIAHCPALVADLARLFHIYWYLSTARRLPHTWPTNYSALYSRTSPLRLSLSHERVSVYVSSSPPQLCAGERDTDLDTVLHVIGAANRSVNVSVMNYASMRLYSAQKRYWAPIDLALRRAAVDRHVTVRLLVSRWRHTSHYVVSALRSLHSVGGIQVRWFAVPPYNVTYPYARVQHTKYMVTETTVYVGTSNWAGDYFTDTAGVSVVITNSSNQAHAHSMHSQLRAIFDRDWNSAYATPI